MQILELSQEAMGDEITNLKNNLPNQDLTDFIATTNSDLERANELLARMGIIETRYGIINNISEEEEIFFKVLLVGVDKDGKYHKTEEVKEIKCENDFTPYMAGQYSLVSISREEFLGLIEDNLENNFEEVFTFKIIEGKIVQIYQGISIPETPSTKIYPG